MNAELTAVINDLQLDYLSPTYDTSLYHRIFHNGAYACDITNPEPFIIDAGSHIGISVLYFKQTYPRAHLLCFEPDPNNFKLLKRNIQHQHFKNVHLINAALSDKTGTIKLYGQIHSHEPISVGNSILQDWGNQRLRNDECEVQSVQLSKYIDKPVDLLKLDVEGAEEIVLNELGDKLKLIKKIILECHEIPAIQSQNSLKNILATLSRYHFKTTVTEKFIGPRFPADTKAWVDRNHPRLYIVRAEQY